MKSSSVIVGKGIFGKCIQVKLGPLNVCLKVINGKDYSSRSHFHSEVYMLSQFCHPNLPWLFGIGYNPIKIIAMSCFTYCGSFYNVHKALYTCHNEALVSLTPHSWKGILCGVANALVYLYDSNILHNDLKCDNIVLSDSCAG